MSAAVGITRPVATGGEVQDNEHISIIEGPFAMSISGGNNLVDMTINGEFESVGLPVDSISMESIAETRGTVVSVAGIKTNTVSRAINVVGIFSDELHNVDFTASRPSDLVDVVTQQPESGPDAFTMRKLGSHFELSVLDGKFALSLETSRSITATSIVFFQSLDNEVTTAKISILVTVSVTLRFVVSPAIVVSHVEIPFVSIDGVAIKLIGPDLNPSLAVGSDQNQSKNSKEFERSHWF